MVGIMALITIHEAKRQKPSNIEASDSLKELQKHLPDIIKAVNEGQSAYVFIDHLSIVNEPRLLDNIRGVKDKNEVLSRIYNYVLHAEGNGVLKEYENKVVRYKGSAIGGMECHSPR